MLVVQVLSVWLFVLYMEIYVLVNSYCPLIIAKSIITATAPAQDFARGLEFWMILDTTKKGNTPRKESSISMISRATHSMFQRATSAKP